MHTRPILSSFMRTGCPVRWRARLYIKHCHPCRKGSGASGTVVNNQCGTGIKKKYISQALGGIGNLKDEKILENQKVLKTPVVRNGKQATAGYQPDIWKKWR